MDRLLLIHSAQLSAEEAKSVCRVCGKGDRGEAHTVRETAAIQLRVAAAVVSYFLYTWVVKIIVRNLTMSALGFERETTRKMFIP